MQGARQEVLARMAAPSWALRARTRQREPAPYARTLRSQDGERCVSMRKKLPRSLVKGKTPGCEDRSKYSGAARRQTERDAV